MARTRSKTARDTTANLGFEAKLWLAADKLRNNMDAAEYKHVVLGLIFLVFPHRKVLLERTAAHAWSRPGNVPWFDWVLAFGIAVSVLYIPWIFEDLAFRVGNPLPLDVVVPALDGRAGGGDRHGSG